MKIRMQAVTWVVTKLQGYTTASFSRKMSGSLVVLWALTALNKDALNKGALIEDKAVKARNGWNAFI